MFITITLTLLQDMRGYIAEFMCDQVGSRYLQESILEHPTSEDCDLLFEEVQGPMLHLSTDVFANFCVQKLFEKASTEQIAVMAENLKGNILKLSLQTYGCRVVQKVRRFYLRLQSSSSKLTFFHLECLCVIWPTGSRGCLSGASSHDFERIGRHSAEMRKRSK